MTYDNDDKGCSLFLILVVCVAIAIGDYHHKKNNNVIESSVDVEKHNDSLKIKVENLDSAKHAKVIEVEGLDNDSTVKLFYRLIK
uniref:Uncharacterized protein n=1 Tax=Geladintestivirus 3 TaxID=3233135 RepID=A0AAU8MIT6_9CAUD